MKPALTEREAALVRNYIGGDPGIRGNGTQAAIKAGYSPKTASRIASKTLQKRNVRLAMLEAIRGQIPWLPGMAV